MRAEADPELEAIAGIARSASRRSPLYRWLHARHDAFAALIREDRPGWQALAGGFAGLGLLSPEGRPLTPEAVRHTWWRVRRDVAASRRAAPPACRRDAVRTGPPSVAAPESPVTDRAAPGPDADDVLARFRSKVNERSGRRA
ncbi:hypothetical protein IGS68_30150 (plasmid) [Skermanella sp. TT6]|uniref:Uncharacterized protein n=1 Tax=Skermanella cutis TaxID=2775420 RepID=A0ABX7BEA5_9PROT|nr:hypothetical protein [Skermanella sp. TT6]QQP92726.1 hypothetical protein IGS68_30150 [Skermanella sp. TT6]